MSNIPKYRTLFTPKSTKNHTLSYSSKVFSSSRRGSSIHRFVDSSTPSTRKGEKERKTGQNVRDRALQRFRKKEQLLHTVNTGGDAKQTRAFISPGRIFTNVTFSFIYFSDSSNRIISLAVSPAFLPPLLFLSLRRVCFPFVLYFRAVPIFATYRIDRELSFSRNEMKLLSPCRIPVAKILIARQRERGRNFRK